MAVYATTSGTQQYGVYFRGRECFHPTPTKLELRCFFFFQATDMLSRKELSGKHHIVYSVATCTVGPQILSKSGSGRHVYVCAWAKTAMASLYKHMGKTLGAITLT